MTRFAAILFHLAILGVIFPFCHSGAEFLLVGGGLTILVNRYLSKFLFGSALDWNCELGLRIGSFAIGAITFYCLRPGIVPLAEAVYRGLMVSLALVIAEPIYYRLTRLLRSQLASIAIIGASVSVAAPVAACLHPLRTVPKRTPAAQGLAYEDLRFQSADGVRLAAWLIPCEESRGTVIFCHGLGRNRGHGAALFQQFHSLKLNIFAFDFRGHGDSEGHESTFGAREVSDLEAGVKYVRDRFPHKPIVIAGVSLGAAVTLQALPDLGRVDGVWSEGAFARLDDEVNHEFHWLPKAIRRAVAGGYYSLGWLDCGFWGKDVSPIRRLSRDDVPVYFCHGARDQLVPLSEGQQLYERYRGPKQNWWVAEASHYNVRQHNQEEYSRRLTDFINACLTRR
jgi:alpha-beta hydrolase superfamily lysophospholipase